MINFEKQFFPQGKERKDLLKSNAEGINKAQEEDRLEMRENHNYGNIDSHLEKEGASFSYFFRNILPEGQKDLRSYVESSFKEKQGKALGVEFGGVGSNLFRGFSKGFFKETFGITLADHREKWKTKIDAYKNSKHKLDHNVIEGDILSDNLYDNLEEKLNGRKVDIIIERMFLGIEFMPAEPYKLSSILEKWYVMLNEGGIMFIQSPVVFNNLLDKWAEMLHDKYIDSIEFQYEKGIHDAAVENEGYSSFRLRKLKGAPKDLPFLDSKTVARTEKWISSEKEKSKNFDWYLK
ncbi:MAG: hypothetical protein WCW04_00230 [Candidatus Paceibacterota bacterium]